MRLSAGSRRSSPKKKGRGRAMAVNREVPSMATIYLKGRKAGLGITHRSLQWIDGCRARAPLPHGYTIYRGTVNLTITSI